MDVLHQRIYELREQRILRLHGIYLERPHLGKLRIGILIRIREVELVDEYAVRHLRPGRQLRGTQAARQHAIAQKHLIHGRLCRVTRVLSEIQRCTAGVVEPGSGGTVRSDRILTQGIVLYQRGQFGNGPSVKRSPPPRVGAVQSRRITDNP